ncbi:sigma factor-like helix-turn-helix DNA-binding protein [Streptomyces sp. NPDC088341]|uniref:sigma factor-like helix-turn-helix DNA-binding protein n=1 Tax=Streptomyces sp. NPDC088341 TaxID=3154870 RepID=UPI00342D5B8A
MSGDGVHEDASSQEGPLTRPALNLPLDFEAFYLGHQEPFHDYAEVQVGNRPAAEEVIHRAFLEILGGWNDLLRAGNLEQQAWAIVRKAVDDELVKDDREPAFVLSGPIAQALRRTRDTLLTAESPTVLYEAIAELPPRQFEVIVLRYVLKHPVHRVARFVGLSEPAVEYYIRKAKDRLRLRLKRVAAAEDAATLLVTMRFARERLGMMEHPVYSTIAELPPRQFEVVVLRYVVGYPVRRIARLMGLHERTVDHHIRKAKDQFGTLLTLPGDDREEEGGQ